MGIWTLDLVCFCFCFLNQIKSFFNPVPHPRSSSHISLFGVLDDPKYISYTFIKRWSFDDQQKNNHFSSLDLFLPFPGVCAPSTHIICRVLNYTLQTWTTIGKSPPLTYPEWRFLRYLYLFYLHSKSLWKVLLLLRGSQNLFVYFFVLVWTYCSVLIIENFQQIMTKIYILETKENVKSISNSAEVSRHSLNT